MTSTLTAHDLASGHAGDDDDDDDEAQDGRGKIEWEIPCEWKDCNEPQITLDALLEHMYTAHVKTQEVGAGGRHRKTPLYECRWSGCAGEHRNFHKGLTTEKALLRHLRTVFERDRRWLCGHCGACFMRTTELLEHIQTDHDAIVRSPDHGAKSAARMNGTHKPLQSGARPRPPRYSTARTDGLFKGWREPIDLRALGPKPDSRPCTSSSEHEHEHANNDGGTPRGAKRKRDHIASESADASGTIAESNGRRDRQVGTVTLVSGRPEAGPIPMPSAGRWQSAKLNTRREVDMVNSRALPPARAHAHAHAHAPRPGAQRTTMSASPRDQPPQPQQPQPPPPPPLPLPLQRNYHDAYIIEKAKYRFVLQRHGQLREELEQLNAEYENMYALKETVLDQVLRAKFGSTADILINPPSR